MLRGSTSPLRPAGRNPGSPGASPAPAGGCCVGTAMGTAMGTAGGWPRRPPACPSSALAQGGCWGIPAAGGSTHKTVQANKTRDRSGQGRVQSRWWTPSALFQILPLYYLYLAAASSLVTPSSAQRGTCVPISSLLGSRAPWGQRAKAGEILPQACKEAAVGMGMATATGTATATGARALSWQPRPCASTPAGNY